MNVDISWAANWHCPFCNTYTEEEIDSDIVGDYDYYWSVSCACGKSYHLDKETGEVDEL